MLSLAIILSLPRRVSQPVNFNVCGYMQIPHELVPLISHQGCSLAFLQHHFTTVNKYLPIKCVTSLTSYKVLASEIHKIKQIPVQGPYILIEE